MKIAFAYIGSVHLGLEMLSAILKREGHEVRLFFDPSLFDDKLFFQLPRLHRIFDIRESIVEGIVRFSPDLLAFSSITEAFPWCLDLAGRVKARLEVPVLVGGVHATSVPDRVIAEPLVDMVNVGEGFLSLPELALALEEGRDPSGIQNIWVKQGENVVRSEVRPLVRDLDTLPFPDKGLFGEHFDVHDWYLAVTSVGCPLRCTFCCNHLFNRLYRGMGPYYRRRSPGNVIAEIRESMKTGKIRSIVFMDDIFTLEKPWLREFAARYKDEIGLPYQTLSHVWNMDGETVGLLKESGCFMVELGVQCANEGIRREVCKRTETNREIERAFRLCEKHGLHYCIDHIVGFPGETVEHQWEAARFYSRFKPARITFFWLAFFPRTEMMEIGRERGLLSAGDVDAIERGLLPSIHDGLSMKDAEARRTYDNFQVFFLLVPFLPRSWNLRLARSRKLLCLRHMPYWVRTGLDFLGGVRSGNREITSFARRYARWMARILSWKAGDWMKRLLKRDN